MTTALQAEVRRVSKVYLISGWLYYRGGGIVFVPKYGLAWLKEGYVGNALVLNYPPVPAHLS